MHAKRILSLVPLLLALSAPGVAQADLLDNQLAQLRPIAEQWWAGYGLTTTRCDSVEFSRQPLSPGLWAMTMEGSDLAHPLWPDLRWSVCHVVFSEALTTMPPAKVCTVVLHEWGHILGLDHSADPTNIMYGAKLIDPPPVCAMWGAPPRKGVSAPGLIRGRSASRAHMRRVMAFTR